MKAHQERMLKMREEIAARNAKKKKVVVKGDTMEEVQGAKEMEVKNLFGNNEERKTPILEHRETSHFGPDLTLHQ